MVEGNFGDLPKGGCCNLALRNTTRIVFHMRRADNDFESHFSRDIGCGVCPLRLLVQTPRMDPVPSVDHNNLSENRIISQKNITDDDNVRIAATALNDMRSASVTAPTTVPTG